MKKQTKKQRIAELEKQVDDLQVRVKRLEAEDVRITWNPGQAPWEIINPVTPPWVPSTIPWVPPTIAPSTIEPNPSDESHFFRD